MFLFAPATNVAKKLKLNKNIEIWKISPKYF